MPIRNVKWLGGLPSDQTARNPGVGRIRATGALPRRDERLEIGSRPPLVDDFFPLRSRLTTTADDF